MKLYSGRCRGGPWDGKDLEAEFRTYKVAIMPPLENFVSAKWREQHPPDHSNLKWGQYEHILGQWVWHANC
jgi:hypothetical protein